MFIKVNTFPTDLSHFILILTFFVSYVLFILGWILDLVYSPKQNQVFSLSDDCCIKSFDVNTTECKHEFSKNLLCKNPEIIIISAQISAFTISSDNKYLIVAKALTYDICVWSISNSRLVYTLKQAHSGKLSEFFKGSSHFLFENERKLSL